MHTVGGTEARCHGRRRRYWTDKTAQVLDTEASAGADMFASTTTRTTSSEYAGLDLARHGIDWACRRVCVFCGSAAGARPEYSAAARSFGETLARRGLGLVYGGAHIGIMRVVADAVLAGGGEAIGVIPKALQSREIGHQGLTELHVVSGMHERKAKMAELADGFVALPGGLGTLEEVFEVWTWAQLGFHRKPVCLLDVEGYWGPLLAMVDRMVAEQFVKPTHREMLLVARDADALLDQMDAYVAPPVPQWLDATQL